MKKTRIIKVSRALVCGGLVAAAVTLLATHVARGAAGEAALTFARQFDGLADLVGSTKAIELNGQRMFVSTALAPQPVTVVVQRFKAACETPPDRPGDRTPRGPLDHRGGPGGRRGGTVVLQGGNEAEATLSCFLAADPDRPRPEIWSAFLRTRESTTLGNLVVMYARAMDRKQTHVLTAWARGPFNPLDMFPANGDAPGSDSPSAARPRSARRILSGAAPGTPYGLRTYEVSQDVETTLGQFDADMAQRGYVSWTGDAFPPGVHGFIRGSGTQAMAIAAWVGGKTVLSVVDLGEGDRRWGAAPGH